MDEMDRLDREMQVLGRRLDERLSQVRYFREGLRDAMRALDAIEGEIRTVTDRRDRAERQRLGSAQGGHGVRTEAFALSVNAHTVLGARSPSQEVPTWASRTDQGEADATGGPSGLEAPRDAPEEFVVVVVCPEDEHAPSRPPRAGMGSGGASRNERSESFSRAVRRIAHRSVAQAGRSLSRRAILDDLKRAGVPLPTTGAAHKVSKILGRDPDLFSDGGRGYKLGPDAMERELRAIKAEATAARSGDV